MAYPILALFMAAIVPLGRGPAVLGLVEGVAEAVVSFMKGASGVHTDITGRRVPYIQAGYLLTSVSKPIIALARSWPLVLVARALDRFGKGIRTTSRDTLIVDTMEKERLGAAFGLHRAMDTAGAFVGVLLTLALLYIFRSSNPLSTYRTIFLVSVIPGGLCVLLTLRLKDVRHESADDKPAAKTKINLKDLPAGYWKALVITTVFALANSSDTFLVLRANDAFKGSGPGSAAIAAIWAYALYNLVYTLVSYPAGELSDRIGRWWVLGLGWLLYAFVYAGFAVSSGAVIWLLFGVYGVYIGMTDGVSKALVGDFSPKTGKGTAMGLYYMVTGFATLAASGIMGILWTAYGYQIAFYFGAATALASVLLVVIFGRAKRTS
jgi:MFS family permease